MFSFNRKRLFLTLAFAILVGLFKYQQALKMSRMWSAGPCPRGTTAVRTRSPLFNALTATAHELQDLMSSGKLKSTDLVQEYVWRTEEYNGYLRAVSQYAPSAMERAEQMDRERAAGRVFSPLHGIPVLLKNTIATESDLEMDTTAGALALVGSKPRRNAPLVDQLLVAGVVILGKSTSSELNWNKDGELPCGWSSVDGQSQSPYVHGGMRKIEIDGLGGHSNPGSSSTGSAVAVAAGLVTVAVGCDTEGSLTAPAIRASLYSMRPSTGFISAEGIVPLAHSFDTPGPLAKDPQDIADLLTAMMSAHDKVDRSLLSPSTSGLDWRSLKIGTIAPDRSPYPDFVIKPEDSATAQMHTETLQAYAELKSLVGVYHENVDLPEVDAFSKGEYHSLYTVMDSETKDDFNRYLGSLSESKVRSLQDLVRWNEKNVDESIPPGYRGQSTLLACLQDFPREKIEILRKHYEDIGSKLNETLVKHDIDVIVAPGDGLFAMFAAAHGSPVAALPLSYLNFNGRAWGLMALAGRYREADLLAFMQHYATVFPRSPPTAFEQYKDSDDSVRGQL